MDLPTQQLPTHTRLWRLASKPTTRVSTSNYTLTHSPLPSLLPPNHILLKLTHISNDPAQRVWMDAAEYSERPYAPTMMMSINSPISAFGVATVMASSSPEHVVGDRVAGQFGWAEYIVVPAGSDVRRVPAGVSPQQFLAGYGITGMTAYFCSLKLGGVWEGASTVVVSAAAGAVGVLLCQILKMAGAGRVIAVVGSEEKGAFLKGRGWADVVVSYKDPMFEQQLREATPGFIDVYYDLVGGRVLDACIRRIAHGGKIIAVGVMSAYERDPESAFAIPMTTWVQLVYQGASVLGFILTDWIGEDHMAEQAQAMDQWVREGKIELVWTEVELGIEDVPEGLRRMMDGGNLGKMVTALKW